MQVCNQTTLLASHNLVKEGLCPIALNFANGIAPGGGFRHGAKAQEEVLCCSSALYLTLLDDPMYDYHLKRPLPDSSDWVIYSPKVPVFRSDNGLEYDEPWLLSFLSVPHLLHLPCQMLRIFYKSAFTGFFPLRLYLVMKLLFWALGVVELLRMIPLELRKIFGKHWKQNLVDTFQKLFLQLPTGHLNEDFLGLSVICLTINGQLLLKVK